MIKRILLISLIASLGIGLTSFVKSEFELAKHLDIYYSLVKEVLINYVDEVDPGELIEHSITGMLKELDPYTNYIPENDIENIRLLTTGEYGGIGAVYRQREGINYIVEPYENSPASKAGLRPGDIVLSVDGRSIDGMSPDELSEIFQGQPGTKITLTIRRPGETELLTKELIREKIETKSVPYHGILENGIAYMNLSSFTTKAHQEIFAAIKELEKEQDLNGIIIDVRNNPGGLLMEAVKIVNLFVPKGQEVVSTKGKVEIHHHTYLTPVEPHNLEVPVAVLINSQSASASEIVSGALQDLDRAVVIGERSFGKGLVQQNRDLSYNAKLKITTAKYYIPSGRCIQAVDYSLRDENGRIASIPDSLMKEFTTKNGRKVYDGGGIMPDLEVKNENLSELGTKLYLRDIIFDFATQYYLQHDTILPPKSFTITDSDYQDFIAFVKEQSFDFTRETEKALAELKEMAQEDQLYDRFAKSFDQLAEDLKPNLEEELMYYRAELTDLIQTEIIFRYFGTSGQIEYSLQEDKVVQEALKTLSDSAHYQTILGNNP